MVLLAHPLLGPFDRARMIARIGFHPALIVVRPLAQRLLADLGDADDAAEEVHHQLRPRQRRQIAVNDNPIEAVIDEDQELAEQLGEDVHPLRPRNGRSEPDRAKLCATALGFNSPTRFAPSSDGPPLMTDASSPSSSLSCSRPKQAMLGSSTPPIASPPASPATRPGIRRLRGNRHRLPNRLARKLSPRRIGIRLHRSSKPPRIDHPRLSDAPPRQGLKFQIFLARFQADVQVKSIVNPICAVAKHRRAARKRPLFGSLRPYREQPGRLAQCRDCPFVRPLADDSYLRIAVVHCVVYAPWNSAPRPHKSSFILTN